MKTELEETKPRVIPKLRFPEFQGKEPWDFLTLGDVTIKTDKRNRGGKSYPVYSISNKTGFTPQSEQFEGVNSEKRGYDLSLYKLIEPNTFAYNPARINVGSIGYSRELNNIIISSLYVCFRALHLVEDQFLLHFFGTRDFEKSVSDNTEGGIRSYLFYENFARISIPIPCLPEQQKIADCLGSLDELITAQSRKVDLLKTHKKGLMQQLFPREGETVPRLRFAGFEGEWEVKPFGELLKQIIDFRGRTPLKLGLDWGGGNIISLSANNVKNGFIDYAAECNWASEELYQRWMGDVKLEINDIIFTMEAPLGQALLLPDSRKYILSQRVVAFKTINEIRSLFLLQLIWSEGFQKDIDDLATGSTAKGINQKALKSVLVKVPKSEEQQRIADFLTTLDNRITSATRELDVLKLHKKGLMQGLFPITGS